MIPDMQRKWKKLELMGEVEVTQHLANQTWGEDMVVAAKAWLEYKKNQRSSEESAARSEREERMLSINLKLANTSQRAANTAEESLLEARSARRAAWTAAMAAIAAAIIAAIAIIIAA